MMYYLKALGKMQRRVAIQILGAFKTFPLYDIKAIAELVLIKLHLQKLGGRSQLQAYKLPSNYLVRSLMDSQLNTPSTHNVISLNSLTNQQRSLIKGHLVDMANKFNECFSFFSPLHSEFSPRHRIIDNFSDHFSFNVCDKEKDDKNCVHQLDKMVFESSSSPFIAIIASNASIKNSVATSISHTHIYNRPITKTIYYVVHITSTEAELFAIRCSINQALNFNNMSKIIVVTNSIHVTRKIFELFVHPYQVQSAAILSDLCSFFECHENNSIEFWECPSCLKQHIHNKVDKETKIFNPTPLYLCKMSWDFSKKSESNNILKVWKMTFQASDLKGNQFLDLLNDDNNIIKPSYVKGRSWLKTFCHLNSLCARATRAITNHTPIGEHRLRFFPREEFKYPCSLYSIESRCHILHKCGRFNGYYNLRRDSLSHFVMFLETNLSAFTFSNSLV